MSSNAPDIQKMFQQAHAEGDLSAASLQALQVNTEIGAQIQAALGVSPDDIPSSEVVLVTLMPDDSGSIQGAGNAQVVRDGHNLVIDTLLDSKQKDGVLVHTRYLNGEVLYPYRPLEEAVRMDSGNYAPGLGTPLYDQTAVLLGTVLAKSREFEDAGVPVRTITLIITDGADLHSHKQTPKSIRSLVEDLVRKESHIVAAMGISDGYTDFGRVFRDMGIPDEWVLTPGNTPSEIRSAFRVFSQSALRASQSSAGFAQASLAGFLSPNSP